MSAVLTEPIRGNIYRTLYHGKPYFVMVQKACGVKSRAVARVVHDGGGWKFKGPRMQFEAGDEDSDMISDYLRETIIT